MNPDWNTPPNGDFALYVERLTAQMSLPRPDVQQAPNVIDDVAERPGLQARPTAVPAAVAMAPRPAMAEMGGRFLRGALGVLVLVLVGLHLVFGISLFVLLLAGAAIAWIAFLVRGAFSGPSAAALRERIQAAARQAGHRS